METMWFAVQDLSRNYTEFRNINKILERHSEEFEGHVRIDKRRKYVDEVGVFLLARKSVCPRCTELIMRLCRGNSSKMRQALGLRKVLRRGVKSLKGTSGEKWIPATALSELVGYGTTYTRNGVRSSWRSEYDEQYMKMYSDQNLYIEEGFAMMLILKRLEEIAPIVGIVRKDIYNMFNSVFGGNNGRHGSKCRHFRGSINSQS